MRDYLIEKGEKIHLLPGQKAVILTREAWDSMHEYFYERLDELPEKARIPLVATMIQTDFLEKKMHTEG